MSLRTVASSGVGDHPTAAARGGTLPEPELVLVADYDPTWPHQFDALRVPLAGVLGDIAISIEHVGSTAVPGLAAKSIIDLDVVIASREELPAAIKALAELGYVHEGDLGIPGREAFRWPADEPRHHLYVCAVGNEPLQQHLAFRDYLRAHQDVAAEYARLKRRLAREHGDDREAYTRGQSEFIERVLRRAVA